MARRRQYSRKTKRTRRSKNKGKSKSRRRSKSSRRRSKSRSNKKKSRGKRRSQSGGNSNCENLYLNESGITMKSLVDTNINLTDEITNDLLSGQGIDIPNYKVSINPN